MHAIILAVTRRGDGSANVIGRTDEALWFGCCRAEHDGVRTVWSRVLSGDGSNQATILTSWKVGHVAATPPPSRLESLFSEQPADFVARGDLFEIASWPPSARPLPVRMSQATFDELMRGLLQR